MYIVCFLAFRKKNYKTSISYSWRVADQYTVRQVVKKEFHGWVDKSLTQRWWEYFKGGRGLGGAGGYNSAFIADRGSEQQVKINGQVGIFTEKRGQLRKYSNFLGEWECRWLIISFFFYMCVYILKYFCSPIVKIFFPKFSFPASEKWISASEVEGFFST